MEDVSLEELYKVLKQRFKLILFMSLLGLMLSGIVTFFLITPQYESTSRLVVNQIQSTSQTITNNDIQTNLNLINTYQSIIKEPIILENVSDETGVDFTLEQLRKKINVQIETNSLVFGVSVQDDSPYVAAELANSVAKSFQTKIGDILEVESVTILSEAVPNLVPVSPNIPINLVVGLVTGLMIGISFAYVAQFMDKRVKDNKIIDDLGWTNLGSIFEMSNEEIKSTRVDKKTRTLKDYNSPSRKRV